MKSTDIIKQLEEIREAVIWDEVVDVSFSNANRKGITIAIDDIISRVEDTQYDDDK